MLRKKTFLKIMVPYLITEYLKITQYNRSKIIIEVIMEVYTLHEPRKVFDFMWNDPNPKFNTVKQNMGLDFDGLGD